ncbi:hypothetical protein IEQ34_008936 [Dendrobium chrysotoxum]|uniref:CASP-like protein n=1 Tax=Dendrobium chrysotoxum TaxID=161865 RepID=A0AAV7GZ41_DENCH|nr:hypothetical protein IEQ34_008936 [Dendrobium chrysotoxum]
MKLLVGSPGTVGGLLLRTGQCLFSSAAIAVMFMLFSYLIASMGLQALWSLGLGCLDCYALRMKRDLHNPILVSLFVVGDWVTATLSLAAACSSVGVTVLFVNDLEFCRLYPQLPCYKYEISIIFAFITWLLIAMSSLVMFCLLASV